jgi:soluble lytic murein transglycosylase
MRFLIIILFLSFSAQAQTEKQFIDALNEQNWSEASKTQDNTLKTLAKWVELLNDPDPSFNELTNFIKNNPNWPKQNSLKKIAEEKSLNDNKDSIVLSWFQKNSPKTIAGRKKYISLLNELKIKKYYIRIVWKEASFTQEQEKEFIKDYTNYLTKDDHLKRINYLLFNNNIEQAIRTLKYLPANSRILYQARIHLHQGNRAALSRYKKLSKIEQKDSGILYNLAYMYETADDEDKLTETLTIASKLGKQYQTYFWKMKSKMIRRLIQKKYYKTAYLFARTHGHVGTASYSEAEWLSGWIALRFLKQPKLSITHFKNMYNRVKMPVSLSRGSYWLGRSYEALKDTEKSNYWYKKASKYYISFYGQLAICKINNCQVTLPKDPKEDAESLRLYQNNRWVKAALILDKTKYSNLVQDLLFKALRSTKNIGEIVLITKVGLQIEQHHLSVETAKQASYRNIQIMQSNYPIVNNIYSKHKLDNSLVLALIRQESVFNYKAISSAGAMGLMQMMPHVAKKTAKEQNIKFKQARLIEDPLYNTTLGTAHLEKLLGTYNNSYILSIAAYNAGDKALQLWLDNNGDPREMNNSNDIIDWMESITFYETRNYVQRVLEGKAIYNILINKEKKLSTLKDLQVKKK